MTICTTEVSCFHPILSSLAGPTVLDVPGQCLEVRKRGKYVAQLFITDGVIITDGHCFDVSRRCGLAGRVERVTYLGLAVWYSREDFYRPDNKCR